MRCRFKHKIFQNEENGYTIAIFTTQDTSVPLSARDKYLASRNIIGFSAIGFGLPLTDEIELEMEGRWESGEHGTQYQVENFMEVVPRTKEGILGYLSSGAVKGTASYFQVLPTAPRRQDSRHRQEQCPLVYRLYGHHHLRWYRSPHSARLQPQ